MKNIILITFLLLLAGCTPTPTTTPTPTPTVTHCQVLQDEMNSHLGDGDTAWLYRHARRHPECPGLMETFRRLGK